ncbi:c-type cytochrome [Altericroceibacterium endophyticum]|uniref:Cytochrome c n=1 Tax=Altericroceibacterium endophyticum TaxID=1808508 RepID=A0A6I4T3H2_9SPHN|nr:cytochrome c [Altericroceibacterium endophyticum]MXO64822.1 cytochrome c [Altericroceibacterium endophyticum]
MIYKILAAGALGGLCIGGVALMSYQSGETPAPRPPEQVYAETCGYCHGKNVGPVIRGRNLPAATIKSFVRMGPNAMPAFRQTEITDDELDALATWLQHSEADPEEHGQ